MKLTVVLWLSLLTTSVIVVECRRNSTIDWLIKHGFIKYNHEVDNNHNLVNNERLVSDGIKKFQSMAGFPITGHLDDVQINATTGPLCLSTNVINSQNGSLDRVWYWGRTRLTWRYFPPYSTFATPPNVMESIIQRAFDIWTQDIPLKVYKDRSSNGRADINVHFYRGDHGAQSPICRNDPFDGLGGVLGHGFYPEVGELHLDLSEYWGIFQETFNLNTRRDLFSVIFHEIGHVLGLDHSPYELGTAMRFTYMPPQRHWRDYKIDPYDLQAIKRLYPRNQKPSIWPWDTSTHAITRDEIERRNTPMRPTTTTTTTPRTPEYQPGQKISRFFDALFSVSNELVLIKGQKLWRLGYHGVLQGFPKSIGRFFSGYSQPTVVDAMYQRSVDHYFIVFSENLYYRYNGNRLVRGYPKRIVDLLGREERITDIKPMRDAEYLVYFIGESRVFLFNEFTNRVVYIIKFNSNARRSALSMIKTVDGSATIDAPVMATAASAVVAAASAIDATDTEAISLEYVNEGDLYINSANAMISTTFSLFIILLHMF